MEMKSPPPCPPTVTIRRNPPRKARATPSSAIPLREPLSSPSLSRDIFSTELPQNPNNTDNEKIDPSPKILSEHLKVYLRIRPLAVQKNTKNVADSKNAWPKNPQIKGKSKPKTKKSGEMCVQVNEDLHSVTVSAPQALQETKRIKSEVYEGFSHVFASEASQIDVYEAMVKPLVEDFLKGTSGMLAAMGPSGSGKTHTVFGCAREPGMVPLALRRIFSENEGSETHLSRVFYLSMFEICSEKGKAERMIDLLHDGGDMCMQYSILKGLQETVIRDAQQAESLIAHGMLKRATAMTNSNSQSSRSQCIINIRSGSKKGDEEVDGKACSPMLTIVDLAGAEREKKTGNQGARLLESNFINNTSMVFGLCLRSLLEHQKNRNKPLQKHYKNSLLTRYMQDYLEGRKRMMLILTVKPGVEDYLDTSFLLRQASPFTKIKFKNQEEPVNLTCNKRPNQALPRAEQLKKMKFSNIESSLIDEGNTNRGFQFTTQETAGKVVKDGLSQNIEDFNDENLNEIHVLSDGFVGLGIQEKSSLEEACARQKAEKDKEYQIMQGFSKALWTVLKEYKKRLEGVEIENCHLRDSLTNERTRSLGLENELTNEKTRLSDLENELDKLKSQCKCCLQASPDVLRISLNDASSDLSHCQTADFQEVRSEVSSCSLKELEQTNNEKETDPSVGDLFLTFASCSGGVDEQYPQQLEDVSESIEDAQDVKGFKDITAVDLHSRIHELPISTNDAQDVNCSEDLVVLDMSSVNEEISQLTARLYPSHNCDAKSLELERECLSNGSCLAASLECENANSFQNYEDLKDAKREPTQDYKDLNIVGDAKNLELEGECVSNGSHRATPLESENANSFQNYGDLKGAKGEPTQDYEDIKAVGDAKTLKLKSDCANGSRDATSLECDNANSSEDYEDLKDVKGEPTQLEAGATESSPSLAEDRIISGAFHSHTVLSSSESPRKDDILLNVDEKELNHEDDKLDQLVKVLPKEEWDVKNMSKFAPELASTGNFQHTKKPKRRLLPASSVLLRDMNILDIKDENDRPKGGRGGKRVPLDDEKNRTKGSLSLHNLLTSKLNR
ncbi:hypothetical protein BUALT_Bualt08G0085900 [Buddleja alternifolia]|uniref:Kinesin motor domain-containing protein n=1 Tax=Buddleja alternifolia TaxID=168488 RepID=A0AAV6X682_9LAMI|nr:hypothetical protein BUALT_Bualt08G0085900 [Buddleja alternifolia]